MTDQIPPHEIHPGLRPLIARSLRFGSGIKGWSRAVARIAGQPADPGFCVANASGWFEGRIDSVIERQVYLFGGYEQVLIDAFLELVPADRRCVAVDVGANVGTHSLAFAQAFDRVIGFEPSVDVFASLSRNLALNPQANVHAVNAGLGDTTETRAFYSISNGNRGLGTFVAEDQYDQPLEQIGEFPIVRGDDVLPELIGSDARIDAIKLDIQGFEPAALRGLQETLAAHRPYTWVEVGASPEGAEPPVETLFPYPIDLFVFETRHVAMVSQTRLVKAASSTGIVGDVVVVPRD
jgi:FkbM family methyltransferase